MNTIIKTILPVILLTLLFSSCEKDKENEETDNSASIAGGWTITKYDGQVLQSPAFGTLRADATSENTGTCSFVVSFNGTNNNKENDSFTLSDSNTKVSFTKTDGDINTLGGGGTWTINTLDEHNLKITSQYGLILEMTK